MIIEEVTGAIKLVTGLFQGKEPTPQEQQAKAGVWYAMLKDWTSENRTAQDSFAFGSKWQSKLPFSQNSTKRNFIANNIAGKESNFIISTLCGKINDELIKGGYDPLSDSAILAGMGRGQSIADQTKTTSVNASPLLGSIPDTSDNIAGNQESKMYFIITILLSVAGLILIFSSRRK